jgi:hypothetical protein
MNGERLRNSPVAIRWQSAKSGLTQQCYAGLHERQIEQQNQRVAEGQSGANPSAPKDFPANRENNREFSKFEALGHP